MAENSLFPAFVELNYHSAYSPHVMTIPLKGWNPGVGFGDIDTWSGSSSPADTMIEDLVDKLVPFFPSSVVFDSFVIYTKATVDAQSIPRAAKTLGVSGTNITVGNNKAVQGTITAKTSLGGVAKIVLLDVQSGNSFERVTVPNYSAALEAFVNFWFGSAQGFAGRDGGQPYFFLQVSYTLNEKLRREYRMT